MRHRLSGRQLNRNSSHRRLCSVTWPAPLFVMKSSRRLCLKAKELRRVVEPLITLAKSDSVANRRLAFARTRDRDVVGKLLLNWPTFSRSPRWLHSHSEMRFPRW